MQHPQIRSLLPMSYQCVLTAEHVLATKKCPLSFAPQGDCRTVVDGSICDEVGDIGANF